MGTDHGDDGRPILAVTLMLLAALASAAGSNPAAAESRAELIAAQDDPPPADTSAVANQQLTLAQLGYGDLTVTGSRTTIPIELPLRPGQAVLTTSTFTLRYVLSPAIDAGSSSMTVSVNGTPRANRQPGGNDGRRPGHRRAPHADGPAAPERGHRALGRHRAQPARRRLPAGERPPSGG